MLPVILLSYITLSVAAPGCDPDKVAITGGEYRLTNGTHIGSRVEYTCPEGKYPHPAYSRECQSNGQWKNEKVRAECRVVQCPRPVQFEHGEFFSRKPRYFVGDVLQFECWAGFHMYGPENRTCQANGKWSGEETKCDNNVGDCPNPGIPIGGIKVGTSYQNGDTVTYECQRGLRMFGSKERTCMKNKHWSGAEPSCRFWYTYDTPPEVAQTFSASISEIIESSDPDKVEGLTDRRIKVRTDGLMNIVIVIDTSRSVGKRNFETAKEASIVFIEKMASFDFTPRYGVISYASFVKPIVRLSDEDSVDAEAVIRKIQTFQYSEHEGKMGTNTRGGLREVFYMLSLQSATDPKKFLETRNVILLMTDGKHNMGGNPTVEVKRIREILKITNNGNREDYLDVYVFGLGEDIHEEHINDIASKKNFEKHVFKMESVDHMKEAFYEMLDEVEVLQMCGLSKEPSTDEEGVEEMYPWIAKITITRPYSEERCKGSIVAKSFILTAAHCFHLDEELHHITVRVGDRPLKVKNLHRHDKYNPLGKQDKMVEKSFDYDVALLELQEKIQFYRLVRPICLPCTTGTSWALKQRGIAVTCSDHEKTLLSSELVRAMFVAEEKERQYERKDVFIKRGNKRLPCLDDTKKIEKFQAIPDIRDLITDNFLCTGGTEPEVDPQTCGGDTGGPLIVRFKQRYIQVGVISWGTINSCAGPVPALSRDFHTDLFQMLDWLKEKLTDLEFLNESYRQWSK
ncbi:complement factor B-like [Leptodactylus fuscus]|uniref:complement factor B-like n=1 Tax=Leptodactylus fuscus TaxID=238119 RepID=UPI003F4E59FA